MEDLKAGIILGIGIGVGIAVVNLVTGLGLLLLGLLVHVAQTVA